MTKEEADRMATAVVEFRNLSQVRDQLLKLKSMVDLRYFSDGKPAYVTHLKIDVGCGGVADGGVSVAGKFELTANNHRDDEPSGPIVSQTSRQLCTYLRSAVNIAIEDVEVRMAAVKVAEPTQGIPESSR